MSGEDKLNCDLFNLNIIGVCFVLEITSLALVQRHSKIAGATVGANFCNADSLFKNIDLRLARARSV
jgi:hypothetical protein